MIPATDNAAGTPIVPTPSPGPSQATTPGSLYGTPGFASPHVAPFPYPQVPMVPPYYPHVLDYNMGLRTNPIQGQTVVTEPNGPAPAPGPAPSPPPAPTDNPTGPSDNDNGATDGAVDDGSSSNKAKRKRTNKRVFNNFLSEVLKECRGKHGYKPIEVIDELADPANGHVPSDDEGNDNTV